MSVPYSKDLEHRDQSHSLPAPDSHLTANTQADGMEEMKICSLAEIVLHSLVLTPYWKTFLWA